MNVTISTVTPVYRGENYLVDLVGRISLLRERWESENAPVEIVESIFVDDGSVDNSAKILRMLAERHNWVRVITLSRNYGQHSATVAGVCHTHTDWVVTLDEDLQHDPLMISKLLSVAVENCADVIYAWPKSAVHGNTWRDRSSRIVKRFLSRITDIPQIRYFNSFRLIRGSVARAAASSSSSQTYFDVALSWFTKTYKVVDIEMKDARFLKDKNSGYGLFKLIRHARHLVVSSQVDVASAGLAIGSFAVVFSVVFGIVIVSQKLLYPNLFFQSTGWASIMATVIFLGGIITAILCIALEYVNIVLLNQLGKPTFFVIDRSTDELIKNWLETK